MRSPLRSVISPVFSYVFDDRRSSGGGESVFPPKPFYFNDFNGVANNTILRNIAGWAAYNSVSSTDAKRDQWQVQSNAITRMNVSTDFGTSPGLFVIGRDALSADHTLRVKFTAIPNSGGSFFLVVAATAENNCAFFECTNSGGVMQNFILRKNVGGTVTQLLSQATATSGLGRALQAGDEIEIQVVGQFLHLFVNGLRITPGSGSNLDTGGAFTKGQIAGLGTKSSVGAIFDDVYMAGLAGTVTSAATPIFWPGSIALNGRTLPVSGSYAGTVSALDYRVINAASGALVKDWERISGATISAGAWSGNVFVPMSTLASHPKARIQVRAANDTDVRVLSNETAVGLALGSYGQSNSAYRGQAAATIHAVSNSYTWSESSSSVWQGGAATTTVRSQLWASKVAELAGIPCGVVVAGVGSASIESLITTHWPETVGILDAAKANGFVYSWLWTQGEAESEATSVFNVSAYRANFDTLLGLFGTVSAITSPKVGICVIGKNSGNHISGPTFGNANWSAARACLVGLVDKPGVHVATGLFDGTMIDSLHYVSNTYVENGRRAGLSMRKALGYGGYDGRGPIITGAVRSGAVVTLGVDLNGATSIDGTGLTNYEVSVDNFVTTLPISSVAVSGSSVVITLVVDPLLPVKVRSFYGMNFTDPVMAIGTYSDSTTIPVEPLYVSVTAD